ncbi:MAG: hypothetical protein J3R72DRAFT_104827 [Linnemannia gamsii]|nr:MAG: hypothetical protein J3R72DRAFT_104827 [Linnemannia gamsii]
MSNPQQQHQQHYQTQQLQPDQLLQQQQQQKQQQWQQEQQHNPFRLLKLNETHFFVSSSSPHRSPFLQTQKTTAVRPALITPPHSALSTVDFPFRFTEPTLTASEMTMQSDPLDPIQVHQQNPDPLLMITQDPRGHLSQPQAHYLSHHHHYYNLPHSPPSTATQSLFSSTTGTDTMSSSPGPEGQPPVTYMASLIAQQLLRVGESMFNRRADANCVLKVGNDRYFVHVQMLAVSARGPYFSFFHIQA